MDSTCAPPVRCSSKPAHMDRQPTICRHQVSRAARDEPTVGINGHDVLQAHGRATGPGTASVAICPSCPRMRRPPRSSCVRACGSKILLPSDNLLSAIPQGGHYTAIQYAGGSIKDCADHAVVDLGLVAPQSNLTFLLWLSRLANEEAVLPHSCCLGRSAKILPVLSSIQAVSRSSF